VTTPYEILDRKRRGEPLATAEIAAAVTGAVDGSWDDAQLGALLMAIAVRGLDRREAGDLTRAMLDSGESWRLADELPLVGDKHSTGGVGDKVSLVLAPALAACGLPVAMLTGRGLGHTGGTTDKLESIPGMRLDLTRRDMLDLLERTGVAIGTATERIAPADRRLYALRDRTGTVASLPLIAASILSKKLAMGATGVVYDVKTGSGAFLTDPSQARRLADLLVETSREMGARATALVTDMSQPLGDWVGHAAEVNEALDCLSGRGTPELRRLVVELGAALADLLGGDVDATRIETALDTGAARRTFLDWAAAQGAEAGWTADPRLPLAPVEVPLESPATGYLGAVDARSLGLALAAAGGGRRRAGDRIDHGVSLRCDHRIGDRIEAGEEIGRLFLRRADGALRRRVLDCFEIVAEAPTPVPLIVPRRRGSDRS
jgi:pyrimidine-nucleoside phosphorylase